MSKEMLLLIDSMANERGVPKDEILHALEEALASVAAKRFTEEDPLMRVKIDPDTGDYEVFRGWVVVEDTEKSLELSTQRIRLSEAQLIDPQLSAGDVIEEQVESVPLGRIAAQQARQVLIQKVREVERAKIAKNYKNRIGNMLIGVVKRVTRHSIILDMGDNTEALLMREEMIPREAFHINDRLRGTLYEVLEERRRGPQLLISRTRPEFLVELFKVEVPEIGEDVIEIKGAARNPGSRAKIAVKTNDGRIDPIGACVGMRGARVQAVSNELNGERVDIILWDDNPAQLVINAMAPAEVSSIVADEDSHIMDIAVPEDQLSQAIGRNGQNVRLASELTGWTLNVMANSELSAKHEDESKKTKAFFMERLDVDEEIADALSKEGFSSLEEVAYVSAEEMEKIAGFDPDIVAELQRRSTDVLLAQEIANEERKSSLETDPSEDLLALDGMSANLAKKLARHDIVTRENLADLSVDELEEQIQLDRTKARELIMKARAHWFK